MIKMGFVWNSGLVLWRTYIGFCLGGFGVCVKCMGGHKIV